MLEIKWTGRDDREGLPLSVEVSDGEASHSLKLFRESNPATGPSDDSWSAETTDEQGEVRLIHIGLPNRAARFVAIGVATEFLWKRRQGNSSG
jgi:hypothetical protein